MLGGMVALVALHLFIARDITLPRRSPGDQWGYLGSARYLAGDPHTYLLPYFPYFTYGYSIVLAPLVRLTEDPERLFLAIKVLNALLAASVLPLLYAFCRRLFGVDTAAALGAAAAGSLVPPLIAHPSSILAENLVLPLVIATMLAAWAFLTDRPTWQRLLFAPAMVWLHVSHNRFAAAVPLFFLLLAVAAWARLTPARLALANAGLAAVLLVAAQVVRDRIVAARWVYGIETPQGPASGFLDVVTDRHLFQEFLLSAVGQLWYLAVGTLGLAVLGVVLVGRRATTSDDGAGLRQRVGDPQRLTLWFLLATAAAVFAASTYFFTRVVNGSEGFIAGRHNESFVPIWVAAGVVLLAGATERRRATGPLVLALGLIGGLTVILLAGRGPDAFGSQYSPLNVPAVMPLSSLGPGLVLGAVAVAVAATGAGWLLARAEQRAVLVVPLCCAWFVGSVSQEVRPDPYYEGWATAAQLDRLDVDRAAVVQSRFGGVPVYYQYFLPQVEATPWDGTGNPPEPLVLDELDSPTLIDRGGRVAMVDRPISRALSANYYAVALWVLPGSEQEWMAGAGALLPPGFPAPLPEEARAAELSVDDEVVEVAAGESVRLTVHGRHAGAASPWPDEAGVGGEGSVHLAARSIVPPGEQRPAPAPADAPLPRWLWPGDRFTATITVAAADEAGDPLPPGRYEMGIDLAQAGFGWFVAPGAERARVVLEVR